MTRGQICDPITARTVCLSPPYPHERNPTGPVSKYCKEEQDVQLSQRDRAAGWVSYGHKMEDWNW